jgi:hypothetical protein
MRPVSDRGWCCEVPIGFYFGPRPVQLVVLYREERSRPCAWKGLLRHGITRLDPAVSGLTLARLWHHSGTTSSLA